MQDDMGHILEAALTNGIEMVLDLVSFFLLMMTLNVILHGSSSYDGILDPFPFPLLKVE